MSRSIESLNNKELECLVRDVLDKKNGAADIDWSEIVRGYDLDMNPETLRKAGVGIKLAQDAGMSFRADNTERTPVDDFAEKQKISDMERSLRREAREDIRSELLREMIEHSIRNLPPIELPEIRIQPQRDAGADQELVVGIGDFHYGASFTVCGLYGEEINKYNSGVFECRMMKLIEEIVRIVNTNHPRRVTVMIVGDMLDGLLRASQISRLEFGVVDSAIRLSEFMCKWLVKLYSASMIPVRVFAVRGNHGEIRPLGSKAGQFPEENMERIVMHYIAKRFSGSNVNVIADDAPMWQIADVCGYKIMLIHGQGDDIEKIARDHQLMYNEKIDMFMCGHLHKTQTFTAGMIGGRSVLIERIPSMCGIDPYAQSKGYGSPPGATAILMERDYGRRCIYPIVLK